jgi:filamentous hemagglutinin family protein
MLTQVRCIVKRKVLFLAVSSLFADAALAQTPVFTGATAGSSATTGQHTTVNQGTQRAIFDWASFNIGLGNSVTFSQLNSTSVAVNRISGGRTTIDGTLTANGHIMLLNQNGVLFGSTAIVNVGSLTASTGRLAATFTDADFILPANNAAPIAIIGAASGSIENRGVITTTAGSAGLVAFVAPSVINSGTIRAVGGRIRLAGAEEATISLNGGLYEMVVNTGSADSNAKVENLPGAKLTTVAENAPSSDQVTGSIILSVRDAFNAVSGVINLSGVQQASLIEVHGGVVSLKSDLNAATVTGTSSVVNVSKTATDGGQIQDGVNIAKTGGTVNVAAGTYAESVSITKALTLKGAGAGSSIIDPVSGDAVSISGNMGANANLVIDGFTFTGATYGVQVAGTTVLGNLTVQNSDFLGNLKNGFFVNGDKFLGAPGLTNVSLLNDTFEHNGAVNPTSLGWGDILFNFYNGNATLSGLRIHGGGEYNGIQMRGASPTANTPQNAGTVVFNDVIIDGSFLRPAGSIGTFNPSGPGAAIHLLEYASVANVSFTDVNLAPSIGHGLFIEGIGTTLNLGNTNFGTPDSTPRGTSVDATHPQQVSRNILAGTNNNNLLTYADARATKFDGVAVSDMTTAQLFGIEDRITHALDRSGLGLVRLKTDNIYVTEASGSIQRGINAACTCDTVHVAAGTFTEQLTINKSLTLLGSGDTTIVKAPTSLVEDRGMKSIVTIGGDSSTRVNMSGFTIKGPSAGINAGIFVRDGAYAHIYNNKVLDIRDALAGINGNQNGIGIFVGRASLSTSGKALIEDNFITGYQKGGIVVDGPGSDATVRGNTVIGAGATQVIAQNGIQASRGASAIIENNTVSGHDYNKPNDDTTAAGILIFTPGIHLTTPGVITVGPNDVQHNEIGILTNDPRSLSHISLDGVTNNGRNAVAEFKGDFTNDGPNLAFPDWAKSNATMVNGTKFSDAIGDIGNIVSVDGVLRVTGWNGFATIEPAFTAVADGGTVNIAAGSYSVNSISVNKGISFLGPNAGTHGNSGSRVDEAVITGTNPSGPAFRIDTAAPVTFDGLKFEGGASQPIDSYFTGNNITLRNNVFNNQAGSLFFALSAQLTLERNRFTNVSDPDGNSVFVAGNWNGTTGTAVTIRDNLFENPNTLVGGLNLSNVSGLVTGNTFKDLKYYGILLANNSSSIAITNNLFDHITNPGSNTTWGAGIRFYTPAFTGPVVISGNEFINSAIGVSVRAGSDITGMNVQITDNSFHGNGQAIRNEGTGTLNASGNWWGTTDATAVAAQMTGAVDFSPMLASGTDANLGMAGFQGSRDSLYVTARGEQSGSTGRIQEGVNLANAGGTVNVGSGTYAESVVLNGLRNLMFDGTTIEGLTINAGAAGSGIGGSVTANGSTGFLFNAPIRLLSDTSLVARGGNIVLNGDVQGAGGAAFALSLDAGGGDVSMVTGGTQSNPLGHFNVLADDFNLASTLWVSGYDINATGNVALSDHTLNSVGALLSLISAGGNVTGSTTSQGSVQIAGGGDVITSIISLGNVEVIATNVGGSITGGFIVIGAENNVNASVSSVQVVEITSGGTVNVSGSAGSLVLNAPSATASGNFGEVVNAGDGVVNVNGKPRPPERVVELSVQKVVPTTVVIAADSEARPDAPADGAKPTLKPTLKLLTAEAKEAQPSGLSNAAELLRRGQSVEIDLTPGNR